MKRNFFIALMIFFLTAARAQQLDYSFVVVGCNRVENADTVGNPSTANVYQLNRLFSEVAKMKPLPAYLFFAGDLIIGYEKDTVRLAHELQSWISLYKQSPLAATSVKLVAMPGNHESDVKIDGQKVPIAVSERVFVRVMNDYIAGSNGPYTTGFHPGTDSLISDQSRLTYSFNFHGDHFIMLNTDPAGQDSRIPYHWIDKDIMAAHSAKSRHIFAIGHKPAYTSHFKKGPEGIDVYQANRDSFWTCMENNNAVAMFSAHNHLWDSIQPHKGKTWMIIAGNGGSKLESTWTSAQNSYFGYTIVNVYTGDQVEVISMGRDVKMDSYTMPANETPTTLRARFLIAP
jgi:hypothetical protein